MTITSGAIAHIDFEDYSIGLLDGQGVDPYIWSGYGPNEDPVEVLQSENQFYVIDNGVTSGNVIRRNTTTNDSVEKTSHIILQSGIPTSEYNKVIYQWDLSVIGDDSAYGTRTLAIIRPSGCHWHDMRGIFAGIRAKRTNNPDNPCFWMYAKNGDTSHWAYADYLLESDDTLGSYSFQVIDDLNNKHIDMYVKSASSGILEHIYSIDSDNYLDHPSSGAFHQETGANGNANNTLIDNFIITAFPRTYASGFLGGYVPSAMVPLIYANDALSYGVWHFDEIAGSGYKLDSSGEGNHLDKIIGDPVHVAGKFNNCVRTSHWNEPFPCMARSDTDCSDDLSPTITDWTFGGWIKPSGGAYNLYSYIAGKGGYDQYVFYIDEEMELWTQVRIDGIRYPLHGGRVSGLVQDEWQHIDWVVNRTEGYHELWRTPDDGICAPILLDRNPIPSGGTEQDESYEPLCFGASNYNREPFDGELDEWYFYGEALDTEQLRSIILLGIPSKTTVDVSGYLGSYASMADVTYPSSGYIGGYTSKASSYGSGYLGGYLYNSQSPTSTSGYVGAYLAVSTPISGYFGGYTVGNIPSSGYIGGYVFGRDNSSGTWLARFDYFSDSPTQDFDATVRVGDANTADFDAICTVRRALNAPITSCVVDIGVSSVSGYEIIFSGVATVADITLPDGRINKINNAWINWGDFSGTMASVNSITGAWAAKHLYTSSGVYIPSIDVIDDNGAHGSCKKKVDLSVGLSKPITLTLSSVPSTGSRPLAVAFTTTYTTQFAGVIESVLYFGDRTYIHLNDPTHVYKYVGDYAAIWVVKDDSGRFWNDSLDVGVNS